MPMFSAWLSAGAETQLHQIHLQTFNGLEECFGMCGEGFEGIVIDKDFQVLVPSTDHLY